MKYFDRDRSATYDERMNDRVVGYTTIHQVALSSLYEEIGDDGYILVGGVGTGKEIEVLQAVKGWRFVGFDTSPEMLEIASKKFADMKDRLTLINGNIGSVDPESLFDAATLILVSHFLSKRDKIDLYKEIYKRLKPGSPFVVFDQAISSQEELERYLKFRAASLTIKGYDAEDIQKGADNMRKSETIFGTKELEKIFKRAGFKAIEQVYQMKAMHGWKMIKE